MLGTFSGIDRDYEVESVTENDEGVHLCPQADALFYGVYERPHEADYHGARLCRWLADFSTLEQAVVFAQSLAAGPVAPNVKVNTERTVAVATGVEWLPMADCPLGVKVQLLGPGNAATYGNWDGKDDQWRGWYPLPRIPQWLKEQTS